MLQAILQAAVILITFSTVIGLFVWIVLKVIDRTIITEVEREDAFLAVEKTFGLESRPFGKKALSFDIASFDFLRTGLSREVRGVYSGDYHGVSLTLFDYRYYMHKTHTLSPVSDTLTIIRVESKRLNAADMMVIPVEADFKSSPAFNWKLIDTAAYPEFHNAFRLYAYDLNALVNTVSRSFFDYFHSKPKLGLEIHRNQLIMLYFDIKRIDEECQLVEFIDNAVMLHDLLAAPRASASTPPPLPDDDA